MAQRAQVYVSSDNYSPLIQIITWFMFITAALAVLARYAAKMAFTRSIRNIDDGFLAMSLFFALGQSIAVSIKATSGFGRHISSLTESELLTIQKANYAAAMLYIASLLFSKLAVLGLMNILIPPGHHKKKIYGLGLFLVLWAILALLVSAFQCSLPHTWDFFRGRCINQTAWLSYFEITNMLTDAALIVLPAVVIWKVQTNAKRRLSAISFFVFRIVVITASATNIAYLQLSKYSRDRTIDTWRIEICIQVAMSLGIISACILYIKKLLDILETGYLRADDMRRRQSEANTSYPYNTSLSKITRKKQASVSKALTNTGGTTLNSISGGHTENDAEWDVGSQSSKAKIIRADTSFAVTSDDAGGSGQQERDETHSGSL